MRKFFLNLTAHEIDQLGFYACAAGVEPNRTKALYLKFNDTGNPLTCLPKL